jgi:hypothetical protein
MEALKWTGTAFGIVGAIIVALNLSFSGWGFVLFLISSFAWCIAGIKMKEASLVLLQGTFTAINLLGIYRWFFA